MSFTVSPVDDAEKTLAQKIDEVEVHLHEPAYAYGVETCDFCQTPLKTRGLFVDGGLRGEITAANMCVPCFNVRGAGIGWGRGQLYALQPNGDWRLVAGFRPLD